MATKPAQGSGTGAAPATTQTATNSAGGPGAEDPTTQKAESPNPYSMSIVERKAKREDTVGKFPVASIFVGFAIGGPIMLVGLPLGALWIVHLSGCCMTNSIEQLISFWGSVLGGMLALFGIMITAVFVISAFRIDKSARAEAAAEAADAAGKFFHEYRLEVIALIDKCVEKVKYRKKKAIETIDAAKVNTEAARDTAIGRIGAAKTVAESVSKDAVAAIAAARNNVDRTGGQATAAIGQAADDVDGRKAAAIERIDAEVAEVVHAAAEAKARIAAQPDDSPPSDSRG